MRFLVGIFIACLWASSAFAQAGVVVNYRNSGNQATEVSPSNPLPISGSFSASLAPFQPSASGARGTPLSVTTSDSSGSLPTGAAVVVSNAGANLMYCNVNAVAATTSDQPITANDGWFVFTIPSGVTTLHCIATGGSTTANTVGGTGLPAGTGGGSGGGGSSGAVFGPTAAGSPAANPPVLIGGTVDGTSTGNVDNWKIVSGVGYVQFPSAQAVTAAQGTAANLNMTEANSAAILSAVQGSIPAGSALIGGVEMYDAGGSTKATVKAASTASVAGDTALVVAQSPNSATPAQASLYPFGSTPLVASATGTTTATTATLTGTSSTTVYLCTYSIRANATAAATVTDTATGILGGTISHILWVAPLASGLGVDEQIYQPCIPASGTNQAIAVVSGAPGSGGNVSVVATGYYK